MAAASLPEDIILGPPKTAFASAAGTRNAGKNLDSPQRPSFTNHDTSNAKSDRNILRDRYTRDGQRLENDGEKARDSRSGAVTNRRSVKDDSDLWSNVRQPKASGQDDVERSYRRNGDRENDRDREGGRDARGQRGFDSHRRDGERETEGEYRARRAGVGRGRNEPPWARDEGLSEIGGVEDQETAPVQDWREKDRRKDRFSEREWNRAAKADMDPEWMDALEPEDKKQRHTEDDLKAFMESMKTAKGVIQDNSLSQAEQPGNHERNISGTGTGAAKSKVDTPLVVDSNFDGFFGLWKEPKKDTQAAGLAANRAEPNVAPASKSAKPSKFTGFFNSKSEPEPVKEKPPLQLYSPSQDSSSEDKEGFQRILSLLGQQQQQQQQQQTRQQKGTSRTPPRNQAPRETPASPPIQLSQVRETNDLSSLLGARSSPGNNAPPTRDSEFLLNLMKHTQQGRHDLSQANNLSRSTGYDTAPGLLPFSNMMISPHDTPQQAPSSGLPSGLFTDSSREEMPIRDKLNPNFPTERRGPPPGFYDSSNLPRQTPAGALQHSGFPPGIQRPPGLEQFQNMQPQRQGMAPPPGFQTPSRGQNAFQPGTISNNPTFGVPANGRGMPPPGYMNGPPPGFPPPFSHEASGFGGFGDFGPGFLNGQQRRQ
ncbi:hypothetical protein P7C71_g1738, partial [Lecanoromycetidae sp. Uapishka_2]